MDMNGYLQIEFSSGVPGAGTKGWQKIVDGECVALLDINGNQFPDGMVCEYHLFDGMNFKMPSFVRSAP